MSEKITIKVDGKEIEIDGDALSSLLKGSKTPEPEPKQTGEPTERPEKRNLHYVFDTENNPQWSGQEDVWLKETVAISFHNEFMAKGAKYVGDQNGNMTPPRDYRAAFYNASGQITKQKKRHGR